jgi:hypothetical protein
MRRCFVGHILLTAVLLLAIAPGCRRGSEGSEATTGTVRGTVTFEGKPIGEGVISFLQQETGGGAMAHIDSSGHFEIKTPLKAGTYRVAVCPPTLRVPPGAPGAEVPLRRMKRYPNIPEFYHSEYSSDLTVRIDAGENTIVVNMKRQTKPKSPAKSKSIGKSSAEGSGLTVPPPGSKAAKTKRSEVNGRQRKRHPTSD